MKSFKFTGILWHTACVNHPWLDWQLSSCVSTNEFIISKYQSRYHFDLWDRKDTTYEWIKEPNSAGANAFLYFEFSVWCRLITVTRKASSGSYHLTAASRHPSRSLTSSSLIVLLITVLVQQKKLKHVTNCSCTDKKKIKGSLKSFIPSDNSHLSNHEVCWTDSAHIQNLECWQKEGDNHHNRLKTVKN